MCETCITKLNGNKGFTGRVPKPDDIVFWDTDKKERDRLDGLYHELRVYWDRYFSVLAAVASSHEPKERKADKVFEPVKETESEPEAA